MAKEENNLKNLEKHWTVAFLPHVQLTHFSYSQIIWDMLTMTHTCCSLFAAAIVFLLHWNLFKRKGCKVGLIRGKSNWGNFVVWAILSTGADYIQIWWPAHILVIRARFVEACFCVQKHTPAFMRCHSLVRHLDVRLLAAVFVHTLVPSMDIHASLCVSALMFACFTLIYICREQTACEVWLNSTRQSRQEKSRCQRMNMHWVRAAFVTLWAQRGKAEEM